MAGGDATGSRTRENRFARERVNAERRALISLIAGDHEASPVRELVSMLCDVAIVGGVVPLNLVEPRIDEKRNAHRKRSRLSHLSSRSLVASSADDLSSREEHPGVCSVRNPVNPT